MLKGLPRDVSSLMWEVTHIIAHSILPHTVPLVSTNVSMNVRKMDIPQF